MSLETLSQETDPSKLREIISQLLPLFQDRFEFPEITSVPLRESIWRQCFKALETSPDVVVLDFIRVLSRERTHLDIIFGENPKYIEKLLHLADLTPEKVDDHAVVEAALKCLGNIGKQSMLGLNLIATNQTMEALVTRTDSEVPVSVQTFDIRLLFLTTALKPCVRDFVRKECKCLAKLESFIAKAVARGEQLGQELGEREPVGPLDLNHKTKCVLESKDADLVCDVLKVLYNLTLSTESAEDERFTVERLVILIRKLLLSSPKEDPAKKRALVANIMNLLTTVPASCFDKMIDLDSDKGAASKPIKLEEDEESMKPVAVLLALLDMLLDEINAMNVFEVLFPTLMGMSRMAKANRSIRRYLRKEVLPRLCKTDIMKKPEEGTKLRNKLVRLLTHPSIELKEASAAFLFVLCKENVGRMVKYTGFGNAAGMLSLRGLMSGAPSQGAADYSPDSSDSDTEDYKDLASSINPVTGCYEAPRPRATENMTQEQKEVEAISLVNLIDQMSRKGCIQPVVIGKDGRVHPVENVLQLQEGVDPTKIQNGNDSSDED